MTSRTAWARRKTRTSLVSLSTVSHVGRAVSGKWSVSVRIGGLFYINYYENYENDIVGHEIVRIPSYRSNLFSTQTFQELLFVESLRDGVVAFQTLTKWAEHP